MMSKLDVKDVSRYPNILQPQVTAGKSYVQVWGHRVTSILGDCVMSDPSEAQNPCSVPPRLQVSNPLRAIQGRNSFQTLILSSRSSVLDAFGHAACILCIRNSEPPSPMYHTSISIASECITQSSTSVIFPRSTAAYIHSL
jgi:hypothetical protein